jgi:AraC-like DNA-binding protein
LTSRVECDSGCDMEMLPGHSRLHWWDLQSELGLHNIPVASVYRLFAAQGGFVEHSHACMEVRYLKSGRQHYRIEGRDYTLNGGEALITYPDESHGSGHFPVEPGTLFTLRIALPKRSGRFLLLTPAQAKPLVRQLKTLPNRHFQCDKRLRRETEALFALLRSHRHPLSGIAIACSLLQWTLALVACSAHAKATGMTPDIARVRDFMLARGTSLTTLDQLANIAGLSKSRFSAKFRQQVGESPVQHLLHCKTELAAEWLRNRPELSVTDIAMELGFSSSQYFATVFRRMTGRSPSEYRLHV